MKIVLYIIILMVITFVCFYPLFKYKLKCKRNRDSNSRFTKYNDWYFI